MIQFDEHMFQMGWNHQLDIPGTRMAPVLSGLEH